MEVLFVVRTKIGLRFTHSLGNEGSSRTFEHLHCQLSAAAWATKREITRVLVQPIKIGPNEGCSFHPFTNGHKRPSLKADYVTLSRPSRCERQHCLPVQELSPRGTHVVTNKHALTDTHGRGQLPSKKASYN